jgi:OOP family OmpA-OmpF porin
VLDPVATNLKKYTGLRIELQGHTDSVGADRYNQQLSQQRAESVREYLLGQGVSAAQVVARGYGESQPIATNGTPDGRAQNRRVVMKVLQNPGSVKVSGGER